MAQIATRVVLAEDNDTVRKGIRSLLDKSEDIHVIGEAKNGVEALRLVQEMQPDILLLDVEMPLLNGIDVALQLKKGHVKTRVLVLSAYDDRQYIQEMLSNGASGYLLKTSAASELSKAILRAVRGLKYVTPSMQRGLDELFIEDPRGEPKRPALSARQREVLQLLAEGRPMKQVADILHLATRTIAYHKYKMMADLRLKSTAELIQYAVKTKLVS